MFRALRSSFGVAFALSSMSTVVLGQGNVGANETVTVGGSRTESAAKASGQTVKGNASPVGRRKPAEIVVVGSKSTGPKTTKGK